jgi:PRTRC genetic system protein B
MNNKEKVSGYTLDRVLCFYKTKNNEKEYFVTTHNVSIRDGIPVLLAGHPLAKDTIKKVISTLGKGMNVTSGGLLPTRVLAVAPDGAILWWAPAKKRLLSVHKNLGLESGMAQFPALLFHLSPGGELCVHALANNKRPTIKTKLFIVPLWNSFNNHVCMGTAKIKTGETIENRIQNAEEAYFNSQFSHGNEAGCKSGDLRALWSELMASGHKFPVAELLPTKMTLGGFITHKGM